MAESYLGIPGNHTGKTFDKLLELSPGGTQLNGDTNSDVVFLGTGLVDADLVFSVTAKSGTTTATVQFSTTESFASPIKGVSVDLAVGDNIVPFRNAPGNATPYPYVRISYEVETSTTLSAFIGKK